VDHELQLALARDVARPADDELLGDGVELALPERRGIEGVEELRQQPQPQLDPADVR